MKKLAKRITGKEWGMIVLTILFTCFSVYLELEVPTYISQITELLGTSGTQMDALWSPAAKMIGLSLLAFFSSVMVGFFAARVAASYTTHLRRDVFHRVLDFSQTEIKRFSIPSLLTRTTNDITQYICSLPWACKWLLVGQLWLSGPLEKSLGNRNTGSGRSLWLLL